MAQRNEIVAVYVAGVIQGVALVTFPAASAVFTSASEYALSSTQYGAMFVPQAVTAIGSSLLGAGLTRHLGPKRIFLLGLIANLLAMSLLVLSQFVMRERALTFGILLLATGCMGVGFGFTVPTLNTFVAAFFPQQLDKAVLGLNALLGLGTALAPVFVAVFVGFGIWSGLPVLVGVLILALLLFSARLPLDEGAPLNPSDARRVQTTIPLRFWVFATFAVLYGVCETMNGNWASLYMTKQLGASATLGSLALTLFWATVTGGRMLFAAIERWFPESFTCVVLPFVVVASFAATAFLPLNNPALGIVAFALAGLGCSALLPLTISFGQKQLPTMTASVAGSLIAFYQMGYGIAAFGVGPLQTRWGLGLNTIYGGTVAVALAMALLAFVIVRSPANPGTQVSHTQI